MRRRRGRRRRRQRRPRREAGVDPTWASLRDEELLAMRVRDLGVRIEGSELEPRVASSTPS